MRSFQGREPARHRPGLVSISIRLITDAAMPWEVLGRRSRSEGRVSRAAARLAGGGGGQRGGGGGPSLGTPAPAREREVSFSVKGLAAVLSREHGVRGSERTLRGALADLPACSRQSAWDRSRAPTLRHAAAIGQSARWGRPQSSDHPQSPWSVSGRRAGSDAPTGSHCPSGRSGIPAWSPGPG